MIQPGQYLVAEFYCLRIDRILTPKDYMPGTFAEGVWRPEFVRVAATRFDVRDRVPQSTGRESGFSLFVKQDGAGWVEADPPPMIDARRYSLFTAPNYQPALF